MPAAEQDPFSYANAARLLQSGRGSTDEKLNTARDLLKRKLIPYPAPLILNHIFYIFKNSTKEPNNQFSKYWILLHDTLHEVTKRCEYVPEFPDTLLRSAADHIVQPTCTEAVAKAMTILLNFPLPQSLRDFGLLLQNITSLLPHHPNLNALALSVLRVYGQIQKQEQDHKKMISICLPLLEPLLSSSILRRPAEHVLTHAFFTQPNLSLDDIIVYMTKSNDEHLPDITRFLLNAYADTERRRSQKLEQNSKTSSMQNKFGRPKRSRPLFELHHVQRFFRDLISALGHNLMHEQSLSVPRVNALRALFETSASLELYRPSFDDISSIQAEKKVKKGNRASEVRAIAHDIREALRNVCQALLNMSSEGAGADVDPLCNAATSIVKLSVDTVDNILPILLRSCCHRDRAEARGRLFCDLLDLYAVSRTVPSFLSHFIKPESSLFGLYQSIFLRDDVRMSLATTILRLPTGQAEQCIKTIAKCNMKPEDVQSVTFLSAIVLENSRDDKSQLIQVVCNEVVRKMLSLQECAPVRCASLYLLSSLLFAVVKTNITPDDDAFQLLLKCGIIQASCGFPFDIDDMIDFQRRFVENMHDEDPDPLEKYCCIRLLSVLIHVGVRQNMEQEDHTVIRRLLELLFTFVDYFVLPEGKKHLIPNPFFEGSTFDEIIPLVVGVMDVIELTFKGYRTPHGFLRFLRFLVNKYPSVPDLWSDLLEKKVVQDVFEQMIQGILNEEEETQSNFNVLYTFKLILQTPSGYLSGSEEKRIEKYVRRMYSKLCNNEERAEALNVLLKIGKCKPIKLKPMIKESVSHSLNSSILSKLSDRAIQTARLSSKADRHSQENDVVLLSEYVLEKWTNSSSKLEMVLGFVRNVETAMRRSFLESNVIALALVRLAEVLNEARHACRTCLLSKNDASIPHALHIISSLLPVWDHLVQHSDPNDNVHSEAIQACVTFLMDTMQLALSSSVNKVIIKAKEGKYDEVYASARDLLLSTCQYVPRRTDRFSCDSKRGFAISRQLAHALYFLYNRSAALRTIGVEMLSAMCTFESDEVISSIGSTIMKAVDDELSCLICESADSLQYTSKMEVALDALCRVQGSILAAAAALCVSRSSSEQQTVVLNDRNEFSHFVSARNRRDLSGIRLNRELGARVVVKMMELVENLISFLNMLYQNFERAKSVARKEAEELEHIAWSSVLAGLDACEITVARRAPNRLDNISVQKVLQSLSVVVAFAHENGKRYVGSEEQMVIKAMRICRYILHVHGHVGRWTCMGLVRRAVESAGKKDGSGESGAAVADVLQEFVECNSGKEIVSAVLADCCDRIGRGCSAEFRRGLFVGVVSMMKALDDEDARKALCGMSENGQEVMRQAREVYVEERYRGK